MPYKIDIHKNPMRQLQRHYIPRHDIIDNKNISHLLRLEELAQSFQHSTFRVVGPPSTSEATAATCTVATSSATRGVRLGAIILLRLSFVLLQILHQLLV